jgi:WXG100 family type VII secretion target
MGDYDGFSANIVEMDASSGEMRRATQQIIQITNALEARAKKSNHLWEGDARTHYDEAKLRWDAACEKMDQALTVGGNSLTDTSNNYLIYDRKNAEAWSGRAMRR